MLMSNILGLHMHRTRRSQYLPLHNLKRKVLRAEIGFHCLPRELHIVGNGDHMLMSEYYLLRLWTLFLIGGSEADIKLLRRVSYRFQKPHVARELAKLDILDVAPIHLPLLGTNSSDVCIEEIKEANRLIRDTIYAGNKYEVISPPHVEDFCYITDNTYIKENVVKMERDVLNFLNYEMGTPTI